MKTIQLKRSITNDFVPFTVLAPVVIFLERVWSPLTQPARVDRKY